VHLYIYNMQVGIANILLGIRKIRLKINNIRVQITIYDLCTYQYTWRDQQHMCTDKKDM
jgi:hypothetical protein